MFQWLWKQKYRVDRGMAMVSGLNTLLLLCQSERLAARRTVCLKSVDATIEKEPVLRYNRINEVQHV